MFSVMKTELKFFPLCTKNVWPTKSGVTIERRDQVLIGFFAPTLFILSIFSRRFDSTKGPFFNDLAIKIKFFSGWRDEFCPVSLFWDDQIIPSSSHVSFPKCTDRSVCVSSAF